MDNRLRDIRRAKRLTLADVAERCTPPTTAQTIGRLETGMRRLSLPWLRRIADALGVDPADLMAQTARSDVPVAAVLDATGADAPTRTMTLVAPEPTGTMIGVMVLAGQGDYRAGDQLWCRKVAPGDFTSLMNRDVLAPLPVGRFAFGRLVSLVGGTARLLPPMPGARTLEVREPPWLAGVATLIRDMT